MALKPVIQVATYTAEMGGSKKNFIETVKTQMSALDLVTNSLTIVLFRNSEGKCDGVRAALVEQAIKTQSRLSFSCYIVSLLMPLLKLSKEGHVVISYQIHSKTVLQHSKESNKAGVVL